MKKGRKFAAGELRSEYKRSDFGSLVRGKYIQRLRKSSNVVVIDPEVAAWFPNAAAVNARCEPWRRLPGAPTRPGLRDS